MILIVNRFAVLHNDIRPEALVPGSVLVRTEKREKAWENTVMLFAVFTVLYLCL